MTMPDDDLTVGELIARRRAAGYDPEMEALLATIWRCPCCAAETTILDVMVPVEGDPLCPACGGPGIEPVETGADLTVIDGGSS